MLKFRSVIASRSSLLYAKMHQIVFCGWAISGPKGHLTRSSAVAMIADRTTYDIRHTGKLSKQFRLQVDERLVCTIRFNG